MAGEPATSLLLLRSGFAEVFANSGESLGRFSPGATFGEIALLGLFDTRTVTVRALDACHVLSLDAQDLLRVDSVREACGVVLQAREEQVRRGLPLTALPLKLSA